MIMASTTVPNNKETISQLKKDNTISFLWKTGKYIVDKAIPGLELLISFYPEYVNRKLILFLAEKINTKNFLQDIENSLSMRENLYNYFETVKRTNSILSIKVMSLIYKDYADDIDVTQRTCMALAEISDRELEFFHQLCDHIKEFEELENANMNDDNIKSYKLDFRNLTRYKFIKTRFLMQKTSINPEESILFYINDLITRGLLLPSKGHKNFGFLMGDDAIDKLVFIEFSIGEQSLVYNKYVKKALKILNKGIK